MAALGSAQLAVSRERSAMIALIVTDGWIGRGLAQTRGSKESIHEYAGP
jgi:hypothetical protein